MRRTSSPNRSQLSKSGKKGSNPTRNPFRMLQRHKMSACVQLLPLQNVREQPLHIFPRRTLMRLRCRQGHPVRHEAYILRPRPLDMLAFVIIPVRGVDRLREPVNRYISQQIFLAEMPQQIAACRPRPVMPFLQNECGQACRGIVQRIGGGLRLRPQQVGIASFFSVPLRGTGEKGLLCFGEPRILRQKGTRVARGCRVVSDHAFRVIQAQQAKHARPQVIAMRAESLVSNPRISLTSKSAACRSSNSGSRGMPEKPCPGMDGRMTSEIISVLSVPKQIKQGSLPRLAAVPTIADRFLFLQPLRTTDWPLRLGTPYFPEKSLPASRPASADPIGIH